MTLRTGDPAPKTLAPTTTTPTAGRTIATGRSTWPHATETSSRTNAQVVGPAEKTLPVGHTNGLPTRTHKASAQEVLMAAVQPFLSTETNLRPVEAILRSINNEKAGTPPDLRRAASLTGVSNVELLDISLHGGRCYITLHAAGVQRFIQAFPSRSSRRRCFGS